MSDINTTLAEVQAELVLARKDRDQHTKGGENWRRKDARVQLLKVREGLLGGGAPAPIQKAPVAGQKQAPKKAPAAPAAVSKTQADKSSVVVVLLPFPNVDAAVAFQRQILELGPKCKPQVAFCHRSSPTPTETKQWQVQCSAGRKPIFIGVGGTEPGLGKIPRLPPSVEGCAEFNSIIDAANGLESSPNWRARHFLPRLLNDVYFLREDGDSEQKTFDRMMDVVKAPLRPKNGRVWESLKKSAYKKDMFPLWQGFNVTDAEVVPFSLPWYFRLLFCAGVDRKEISEKIGWWISRFKACDARSRQAADKRFTITPFPVSGRNAGFVSLGNYWEARSFQYQWLGSGVFNLAICRNEKGHVAILSSPRYRAADLTRLYHRLNADEPGKWYLHAPKNGRQVLVNGGFRYDAVGATSKGSTELIRLTQNYVGLWVKPAAKK